MKFLEIVWQGVTYKLQVQREGQALWIHYEGFTWLWNPNSAPEIKSKKKKQVLKGLILSPLPGRVDKISVKKGDPIKKDQTLLVISAMKMEYNFRAEAKGVVEDIYCEEAQTVNSLQKLIKVNYVKD